jgi:hypothetical protein
MMIFKVRDKLPSFIIEMVNRQIKVDERFLLFNNLCLLIGLFSIGATIHALSSHVTRLRINKSFCNL